MDLIKVIIYILFFKKLIVKTLVFIFFILQYVFMVLSLNQISRDNMTFKDN